MKITVAKSSGFCQGVENAVHIALSAPCEVCTLGKIIHNETVVDNLKSRGIFPVENIDDIKTEGVVIRSHGVPPSVLQKLQEKNVKIFDATCKFVKNTYKYVKEYSENGFQIVILGEKTHPEIIGVAGYSKTPPIYIKSENEVFDLEKYEKVCVVAQTTFSCEEFNKIIAKIKSSGIKILEVFNTICYTTTVRQLETRELSKKSDLMIVVGSRSSANTTELFNICNENCKNVIFCQNANDISIRDIEGFINIGIVAGASTPKGLIKEVKLTMEELNKDLQPEIAVDVDTKAVASDNDISMEDVMSSLEKKKNFKRGQIIECTIESVGDDGLHCSLPLAKTEVLLSKDEIIVDGIYDKSKFTVGDKLKVKVLSNDGKLTISRKAIEEELKVDESIGEIIEGKPFTMSFQSVNKGGLRGRMGSYSIFVPGSQIKIGYVNEKDFEKYKNKPLTLKVIKAEGKDLVASARVLLEEAKTEKENSFWDKIKVDEIVNGKVMRFTAFGAFVSVDGFDCLAHISDLSWENIKTCEEVLKIGESYDFKVLKADRETNKVSLGYKQLTKRPIDVLAEKYPIDSIVTGKVTKLKPFGAFVEIEPGVEGLVHISQVSHTYVDNIANALSEGEEVDVKVISIDKDKNKINLSIKALLPEPERKQEERSNNNNNNSTERRPRKPYAERETRSDELTNWVTSDGGASIADLLAKMEDEGNN
ncbi:MAG: 4-hydroxy-3-methylbut-2-enyl diphosphate reductase [Clostridia bacterium]